MDLFKEVLPSLLQTKKYLITEDNEKEYTPYVVNRALSQNIDCILYVNELNMYPSIDKKLQYDYYFNTLTAKKRPYQKWYKFTEPSNIQCIKDFFGISSEKAKDALRILTEDQMSFIKEKLHKGGVSK